jgi:hypothetical protein
MSGFRLFMPIGKIDEAKRIVYGTLTAEVADKAGEIFDYASGKPAVQAWSDEIHAASGGKSRGNVRAMHDKIAAGKFTDIVFDDANKRIEGAAKIIDDDEWKKVEEGVYTGFSIGGSYTRRWQDPDNSKLWRFTPELTEISLVDNPCVPTATFEYIKADGSVEMRKFTTHTKEDDMDPKELAGARDALAKGTATDEQKALIVKADADLLKAAQDAETAGTATDEQKALLTKVAAEGKPTLVRDGKPVKPKAAPVQKWLADDGTPFDSKREAEVRNLEIEKQATLAPSLSQVDALLKAKKPAEDDDEDKEGDDEDTKKSKKERREKKAKEKTEAEEKARKEEADKAARAAELLKANPNVDVPEDERGDPEKIAARIEIAKKDYSDKQRKAMAESGEAMEDGSFPIKTKKDLENAVQAYGRAKDKDKAKAHIKARAKALGAEEMLPEEWTGKKKPEEKAAPAGQLEKGMHSVGELACILERILWLINSSKFEEAMEGDDSEMPKKLMAWLKDGVPLLQAMVAEETSEMVGKDEDEVMEMAADWKGDACDALSKFCRSTSEPLVKSDSKKETEAGAALVKLADALAKAGARHSKADADRVQALQDHAKDVHKCMGDMADKCMKMHEAAGEAMNKAIDLGAKGDRYEEETDGKDAQKMSKILDENHGLRTEVAALTKVIARTDETLQKVSPFIETLNEQIRKQDSRIEHLEKEPRAPKGNVRPISKTQDGGGTGDGNVTPEMMTAALEKLTPDDRAKVLMKAALATPMSRIP